MINNKPIFVGLRLCEHDSNIALCIGRKVKYFKSERYHQNKHHGYNNLWEWYFTLRRWGVSPDDVDAIGIVIDDFRYSHVKCDHSSLYEILKHQDPFLSQFKCPVYRIDHHYAHVKSCWPLGINSTTDFVFDGFGDDKRSHSIFKKDTLHHVATLDEAESIGRLLGEVGTKMGVSGDTLDAPGKLMGLKSYGNFDHNFYKIIKDYDIYDASNILNLDRWYSYTRSNQIKSRSLLDRLLNRPTEPRKIYDWVDWLNTTHTHLEKIFPTYFTKFCNRNETVTYSGGIAQNTVINTEIKKLIPNIHIPPHCPDDGLSLGCIEVLREIYSEDPFDTSNFPYWQDDEAPEKKPTKKTIKETAEALARGEIVGWYQGHGEIGPRALGNRSVLMNPSIKDGKDVINSKVKFREPYRPFGASILYEHTSEYFDWDSPSPFMLFIQNIKNQEDFKPVTHVDGTCRIQTVQNENPLYRELLEEFNKLTGIPMLLNTSLNVNGKPIAGYVKDAWSIFYNTSIDRVIIGNDMLVK